MIREECRRLREVWLRAGETVQVGSRTRFRRTCMYAGAVITTLTYMHMHIYICTYMHMHMHIPHLRIMCMHMCMCMHMSAIAGPPKVYGIAYMMNLL